MKTCFDCWWVEVFGICGKIKSDKYELLFEEFEYSEESCTLEEYCARNCEYYLKVGKVKGELVQ